MSVVIHKSFVSMFHFILNCHLFVVFVGGKSI